MQGFGKYKEEELKKNWKKMKLKELNNWKTKEELNVHATSSERYIIISLGPLDSLRFMNELLENLASNLSRDKFKLIRQFCTSNLEFIVT